MLSKDKLIFDPSASDLSQEDNVGAFLRSSDGTLLTHTTRGATERLDVSSGTEYENGTAHVATNFGQFVMAVDAAGNYAPLRVNADGELLADVSVTTGSDKQEDEAHASGDTGAYVLSVREDALTASTSASGDYQSFKTDSVGSLWVRLSRGVSLDSPNTAIKETAVTLAANTATQVTPTALTERKKLTIQNLGKNEIFLGSSTVTVGTGIRVASGATYDVEVGPGISYYAITATAQSGANNLRILEIA